MHSSRRNTQSLLTKILNILASDMGIIAITVLIILAIYLIDTVTPLGAPVWLLYFIPLGLSYFSGRYYAIPAVCIVITLFLAAGFISSPQGIAVSSAFLLRLAFFIAFICAAIFLWSIRRQQIIEDSL